MNIAIHNGNLINVIENTLNERQNILLNALKLNNPGLIVAVGFTSCMLFIAFMLLRAND